VESIARGYQDPALCRCQAQLSLETENNADLLIVVGLELEIGWLPPLINQSTNPKIQVGAPGYLDASRLCQNSGNPDGTSYPGPRATCIRWAILTIGWTRENGPCAIAKRY